MARTSSQPLASVSLLSPEAPVGRAAAAAGEDTDAAAWRDVTVAVPPGPLGIVLDSDSPAGTLLEGFGPVDVRGTRGTVEKHGGVLPGSVLLSVNQYDFTEPGTTFADVGRVLRESTHLERELRFRVPVPLVVESPKPNDVLDDDRTLDEQLASVSPASVELQDDDDDDVEPVRDETDATVAVAMPPVVADDHTEPPAPATTTPKAKGWTIGGFTVPSMPKNLPKSLPSLPKNLPSLPTLAAVKAQFANGGPGVSTMLFADTSLESDDANAPDVFVTVEVPPGPLGLNLDGGVLDHAVVVGFVPLPDGSSGALERHGGVSAGAVLVTINDKDVATATLDDVRATLSDLSDTTRTLAFRLPRPAPRHATAKPPTPRAAPVPLVEDLAMRRKLEMALVGKHDKASIDRSECWFVVDVHWMNAWVTFVARDGPPPGPIANEVLLADGWEERMDPDAAGRPDTPRPGLVLSKDYRCITPMVWSLFAELHGTSRAPLLGRFKLDIDAEPVAETELNRILQPAHLKAAILVSELRDKCTTRA